VADTTGETSANNSNPCLGRAKKSLSRVHLSHLFAIQFSWYPDVAVYMDAVYFTVGRLAHHQAYSFMITDLATLVIISNPLLQIYRCNTVSFFLARNLILCKAMDSLSNGILGWHVTAGSLIGERFSERLGTPN
jgi:hypothetical protein